MEDKKKKLKIMPIIMVLAICVFIVFTISRIFNKSNKYENLRVIINYTDVTSHLDSGILKDDNNVFYIGKKDISKFYDEFIYYDEKYNQIISTSNDRIMVIDLELNEKMVNDEKTHLSNNVIKNEDDLYIPLLDLENIYNIKVNFIKETNTLVLDSLDKKLEEAKSKKNNTVKNGYTIFSKSAEKIKKGDTVYIVQLKEGEEKLIPKDWVKIRTQKGNLGYVKKNSLENVQVVREENIKQNVFDGKISLVWDYFSEYSNAPNRSGTNIEGINVVSPSFFFLEEHGKGELIENVDTPGKNYVNWAHSNGYKVWPIFSNNSMMETTSEIMNDYKLREKLIENITDCVQRYNLDGVNINFENMYENDKEMFSRFLIELAPRLKKLDKALTVDVTEPDGSPEWSLCFDRHTLGKIVDYMMFMAYDETGAYSTKAGTVAGFNWVEKNINKFLNQEEVEKEKLILGIPFYTRLWKEDGDELKSDVVTMLEMEDYIPEDVEKVWDDELKQYYVQYERRGATYKMWIEDERSIKEKLSLIKKYDLQGACFWAKDYETYSIWDIIKREIQ